MSPTAFIAPTASKKWIVRFRLGGRETTILSGGTFSTMKAARERKSLIETELAAGRDPRIAIRALTHPAKRVTVGEAAELWQRSRIDVAENTRNVHRKSLVHVLSTFGSVEPDAITPAEVSAWVGELSARYSPGYVRKIADALAMVLDHHGVTPNPVRDGRVKMPRNVREEIEPPEAEAVEAVIGACAPRYRLALVVLEATGMRVGELEGLTWGDLDSAAYKWRVASQREKGKRGRWVPVPEDVFAAVDATLPREDRDLSRRVFPGVDQGALRTDIGRACRATGTPLWSPHDLRHRRISLWHRAGHSWAQIGEWAGQKDLATTAKVYTHVILGREIDRSLWLAGVRDGVRE